MIWQTTEEILTDNTDIILPRQEQFSDDSTWQNIELQEIEEEEEDNNISIEEYQENTDDEFIQKMEVNHWITDDFLIWKVKEWCSATKITREWDTVEDYPTILENVKLAFKLKWRLSDKPKDMANTLNINSIYILKKAD